MIILNSEGAILTLVKEDNNFKLIDQYKETVANFNSQEIFDYIRGEFDITDSKGRALQYTSYSGDMKPDLKKLDEFIGVDTSKYSY